MIAAYDAIATMLVDLGRRFELRAVSQFDEDQSWLVEVGDDIELLIAYRAASARLHIEGVIGSFEALDREATLGFLLQYNRFWNETESTYLALTPDTSEVVQMQDVTLWQLDQGVLEAAVGHFIHVMTAMRGMLRIDGARAQAPRPEAPPPTGEETGGTFVRI